MGGGGGAGGIWGNSFMLGVIWGWGVFLFGDYNWFVWFIRIIVSYVLVRFYCLFYILYL